MELFGDTQTIHLIPRWGWAGIPVLERPSFNKVDVKILVEVPHLGSPGRTDLELMDLKEQVRNSVESMD